MIAIGASIDYHVDQRDGAFVLEFSWPGFDEMDVTSGRRHQDFQFSTSTDRIAHLLN